MIALASGPLADPIPLGAWEKALADEHLRDDAHGTGWLVELDAPLRAGLVRDALDALRPAFPVHFSRVRPAPGGGIEAVPVRTDVLVHRKYAAGGGRAYLGVMANARLHPVQDGLFRCHLVDGPVPMLGFQATHVVGDGYTNHRFRQAFAAALDALDHGRRPRIAAPPAAYAVPLDEIHARLPMRPRALDDVVRRALRLRTPRMTVAGAPGSPAVAGPGGGGARYALRVFRAVMEPAAFAPLVARAERLGVTPLALLGAAAAGGVRQAFDPWEERPGDFFAVGVPRDMRVALGRPGAAGNLVYGQGVPVFGDDPAGTDAMAAVFYDRLSRGRANRVMYRHFGQRLAAAAAAPLAEPAGAGRLSCADGRCALDPLPLLGVTEHPDWGGVETLAGVAVRDTFFQQPAITRRFAAGRVHLAATVRWHPVFDARIRAFFSAFLSALFPGHEPAWELL